MALALACAPATPAATPSVLPTIPPPQRTPTPTPPATMRQRLLETLTTQQKQQAIGAIARKPEVVEASLSQDGDHLELGLVVFPETTLDKARELGDSFVRLVKSFGPEPTPGKEIGSGTFDYVVTVVYGDGTVVARGTKEPKALRITW